LVRKQESESAAKAPQKPYKERARIIIRARFSFLSLLEPTSTRTAFRKRVLEEIQVHFQAMNQVALNLSDPIFDHPFSNHTASIKASKQYELKELRFCKFSPNFPYYL
jgi:hypothetical protein